jgi:hypothetical protein
MKVLEDNGFQKAAEFVISDVNRESMISESMIVEDIILNVVDEALYNTRDMIYAFVADNEVIYVGETIRSLKDRYYNGYYHKLRNWGYGVGKGDNNERFSKGFSKSNIIHIYAIKSPAVTGPFGTVVSIRQVIEQDMINYFKPICNSKGTKKS